MKKTIKTLCIFALAAVLTLSLCVGKPQIVSAAAVTVHHPPPAASKSTGSGPQMTAAGQVPAPGGISTYGSSYGIFGSQTLGQSFVPTPSTFGGAVPNGIWQTGAGGNFIGRANGAGRAVQPMVPPQRQGPQYENQLNVPQDLGAMEQPLGATADIEPSAPRATALRPQPAAQPQPFVRSPELSDRITRMRAPRKCSPARRRSTST